MTHSLLDLDDSLLRRVVFFLAPAGVTQLLQVSRALKYSIDEPAVWQKLNITHFGPSALPLDAENPLESLRSNVKATSLRSVEWSSKQGGRIPGPREGTAIATVEGGSVVVLVGGWGRGWPTIRNDLFALDAYPLDEQAKAELVALAQSSASADVASRPLDVSAAAAPHYERLRAAGEPFRGSDVARWEAVRSVRGEPMRPRYGHSATTLSLPCSPGVAAGGAAEGILVFGGHFSGGYTAETASAHLLCARVRTVVLAEAPREASVDEEEPSASGGVSSASGGGAASSSPAPAPPQMPAAVPAVPWVVKRDVSLTWEPLARRRGAAATPRGYHAALWVPALRSTLISGGISEGASCWALEALTLSARAVAAPKEAAPPPPGGGAGADDASETAADEEAPKAPAFELDAAPFTTSGAEPSPRHGHSMSLLPPSPGFPLGSVWVFGGADGGDILREGTELRDFHVLDLASRAWTQPRLPADAVPRWAGRCHSATVVGPKVFIYGGSTRMTHRMFTVDTHTLAVSLPRVRVGSALARAPVGRYNHCALRVGRQVLVFAGIDRNNRSLGDTHVLSLAPPPAPSDYGAADDGAGEEDEDEEEEDDDDDEEEEEGGGSQPPREFVLQMILQRLFAQAAAEAGGGGAGGGSAGEEEDDEDA